MSETAIHIFGIVCGFILGFTVGALYLSVIEIRNLVQELRKKRIRKKRKGGK